MNREEVLKILNKKKVIAFMPAFNEEKRIGETLKKIPPFIYKTLVINDGSIDKTEEIAKKMGAVVINHEKNSGAGAAYKTGFKKSLELNPDYVVLVHSDGQHDPEEILDILEPLVDNRAGYTLGARLKGRLENMPFTRYVGNRIISILWSLATGYSLNDALTGFHAITPDALKKLNIDRWSNDYMVETDILEDVVLNDIKIEEVPIKCIYKGSVSLVKPLKDGRDYCMRALGGTLRRIKKKLGFKVIIPDSTNRIWKPGKPSKF